MLSAIVICVLGTTTDANSVGAEARTAPGVMAAYRTASEQAGRDANAHVKLALWCEANGLPAQRLKHLAIAVITDPAHATARGLMGLVAFRGQWQAPDAVGARVHSDATYAKALAQYNDRRARMNDSADEHWKLALWCEQHGLNPEAIAHLTRVVLLEPGRDSAWKRLGYRKQGRRWVTDEQLARERAEAEAQERAERHWLPLFQKWRRWIGEPAKGYELSEAFSTVRDPHAVPWIWVTFARGSESHQTAAVQLLAQIDSPNATRALAVLALDGGSPAVQARAKRALRARDAHEIAALLVPLLFDPQADPDPIVFRYWLKPIAWDAFNSPGWLYVRGPQYDLLRTYTIDESIWPGSGQSAAGLVTIGPRIMQQRARQLVDLVASINTIRGESAAGVLAAREHLREVERWNSRIIATLSEAVGRDLGSDPEAWRRWRAEERGYAYQPPPRRPRQDLTLDDAKPAYFENVHLSCFAAGTPVRTLTGPRPIESLDIGDQVLTQDPHSGALSFRPVVAAVHNKPDKVYKIDLGEEPIRATAIHRFWKAGKGWVRASDLQPGDRIRSVGGVATVKAVAPADIEPVYNLTVLQAESFFVGSQGLLVHDNSEVVPVGKPFDAAPELSAPRTLVTKREAVGLEDLFR
jgi:hypothetical protein